MQSVGVGVGRNNDCEMENFVRNRLRWFCVALAFSLQLTSSSAGKVGVLLNGAPGSVAGRVGYMAQI